MSRNHTGSTASNTGRLLVLGGLALAAITLAVPDASAARGRGWHVDLGVGAGHLELSPDIEYALWDGGVSLDPDGSGGELRVGYGFSPHLRLDLVFSALELDAGRADVVATYAETRLELVSRLARRGPVQPYLSGSLGSAFLGFGPDDDDIETSEADLVSFGGGVEVSLSRHWTMGFDYRYGVSDFDHETAELPLRDVVLDGTATSQLWGLRFQFGF